MIENQKDKAVIREFLIQEMPKIIEEEPSIRRSILRVSRERFADKEETEDTIESLLRELKEDREENNRKWEEQKAEEKKRSEEWNRKWEEQKAEDRKRWEEQKAEEKKRSEEWNRKWEESMRRMDESDRKADKKFDGMMRRLDATIGALGAMWGIAAETSFRNVIKDILEEQLDVKVENITEYDEKGVVFNHPDQVELDMIIMNDTLTIFEIKSSTSKADLYAFHRKVKFYEQKHGREADAMILISPMVRYDARQVAMNLGIRVYSYPEEVSL